MNYYDSMQDLIGRTPLVRLQNMTAGLPSEIYAKLELYNPAGSVKDRVGKYMVEDAKRRGILKAGSTIVEATAGNTGIGIAFAALNQGFHIIFVVPEKFSEEKQQLMRALGAQLVHTRREDGMQGAIRKAKELREQIPGAVSLEQFKNPVNPLAHYETTGPEIYEGLDGQIDYVVLGAAAPSAESCVISRKRSRR